MRDIDALTVLVRSTSPLVSNVDDEIVMLDPATSNYYGLDGVGARIWSLLDEPLSIAAIVETLVREFDVDESTCLSEVLTFVGDLADNSLIVPKPPVT